MTAPLAGDGRKPFAAILGAAVAAAILGASCSSGPPVNAPPQVPGGHPPAGVALIERYGCGSCHSIPGVRGAHGKVGPPLTDWSERGYIAGELPNNGANLMRWIMDPRGVEPGTDMPDLGVSEEQARDIAAYLFTIKG